MIDGVIRKTSASEINVRADKTQFGAVVRKLRAGDKIRYEEKPVDGGAYSIAGKIGYKWYVIEGGYIAVGAVEIQPIDPYAKFVEVPYVSQRDENSTKRNNDCGVACCLMLIQKNLIMHGVSMMSGLTVDRLILDTPLKTSDDPLRPIHLITLLGLYSVKAEAISFPNVREIKSSLDSGNPIILLVNYKYIGTGSFGHYVVAVGHSQYGIYVHDPYLGGINVFLSDESAELALTDTKKFSSTPRQGVRMA